MEFTEEFKPKVEKILQWSPNPEENSFVFRAVRDGTSLEDVLVALEHIEPANVKLAYQGALDKLTTPEAAKEADEEAAALEAEAAKAVEKAAALKGKAKTIAEKVAAKTIAEKVAAKAAEAPPDVLG